jgi:hypothetical protein
VFVVGDFVELDLGDDTAGPTDVGTPRGNAER